MTTVRQLLSRKGREIFSVAPDAPVVARIHGTPAYPLTAVVGVTFHLRGK